MQTMAPYSKDLFNALTALAQDDNAARSPFFSKTVQNVRSENIYSLKKLVKEAKAKKDPKCLSDCRRGLLAGLNHLIKKSDTRSARKIIDSLRREFPDEVTGLAENTVELIIEVKAEEERQNRQQELKEEMIKFQVRQATHLSNLVYATEDIPSVINASFKTNSIEKIIDLYDAVETEQQQQIQQLLTSRRCSRLISFMVDEPYSSRRVLQFIAARSVAKQITFEEALNDIADGFASRLHLRNLKDENIAETFIKFDQIGQHVLPDKIVRDTAHHMPSSKQYARLVRTYPECFTIKDFNDHASNFKNDQTDELADLLEEVGYINPINLSIINRWLENYKNTFKQDQEELIEYTLITSLINFENASRCDQVAMLEEYRKKNPGSSRIKLNFEDHDRADHYYAALEANKKTLPASQAPEPSEP